MSEVTLTTGEADPGLRERLDEEINAFNVAATGYHDARLLSIAARGDSGDLCAGLYGWTWGGWPPVSTPGSVTPNAAARRATRTATMTSTW